MKCFLKWWKYFKGTTISCTFIFSFLTDGKFSYRDLIDNVCLRRRLRTIRTNLQIPLLCFLIQHEAVNDAVEFPLLNLNPCIGLKSSCSSRLLHYTTNCRYIVAIDEKSLSFHSRLTVNEKFGSLVVKQNVADADTTPYCLFTKISTDKPTRCKN